MERPFLSLLALPLLFSPLAVAAPIHDAAKKGDVVEVRRLLAKGADTNARDAEGNTPIHEVLWGSFDRDAAQHAQGAKIIALLLDNGADINAKDKDGDSVLAFALRMGNAEAAKLLLTRGAIVDNRAVLNVANLDQAEIVAMVLGKKGVNVNVKDADGLTPLINVVFVAASHFGREEEAQRAQRLKIIQMLLDKGAEVNVQGGMFKKETPMEIALSKGDAGVAEILLSKMNPNGKNKEGDSLFLQTASKAMDNETREAREGCQQFLGVLLKKGADINAKNSDGESALYLAVKKQEGTLALWLLERGADANTRDQKGRLVLHLAAARNNPTLVKALMEKGADVNATHPDGIPLLGKVTAAIVKYQAVLANREGAAGQESDSSSIKESCGRMMDIAQLLLDNGADPEGKRGRTPAPRDEQHLKTIRTLKDILAKENVR